MERAFVTEFLEEYRRHPCLWQVKALDYKNKVKRAASYARLVEVCKKHLFGVGADEELVKKKINNLRTSFRKEWRRVKAAKKSGTDYTPSLWYFDLLKFTVEDTEEEFNGDDEEETDDMDEIMVKNEPIDETEFNNRDLDNHSHYLESPPSKDFSPAYKKRKIKFIEPSRYEEATYHCGYPGRDEHAVYGECVANRIRKLNDDYLVAIARNRIDQILFEMEMVKYQQLQPSSSTSAGSSIHKIVFSPVGSQSGGEAKT